MIRLKKDVIGVGLGVGGATGCCFLCLFGSSEVLGLFVLPSRVGRARPIPSAQSHPRISTYAPARKITEAGKTASGTGNYRRWESRERRRVPGSPPCHTKPAPNLTKNPGRPKRSLTLTGSNIRSR